MGPHRFAILHLLLMSSPGHVPPLRRINEALVEVGEPAVELALDGRRRGDPVLRLPRAVPQGLEGAVDAHEALHFLKRDARVALWVPGPSTSTTRGSSPTTPCDTASVLARTWALHWLRPPSA